MTTKGHKYKCHGCSRQRLLAERSPRAGICPACYVRVTDLGLVVFGCNVHIPCPTPGCASVRKVTLAYRLSSAFRPEITCPECANERMHQERSEYMSNLRRHRSKGVCDPGCTVPIEVRACRCCRDFGACVEAR